MPGQRAVGPSVVHVELTAGEGPAARPGPAGLARFQQTRLNAIDDSAHAHLAV